MTAKAHTTKSHKGTYRTSRQRDPKGHKSTYSHYGATQHRGQPIFSFFLKGRIVNIFGFKGQEAKWKTLL